MVPPYPLCSPRDAPRTGAKADNLAKHRCKMARLFEAAAQPYFDDCEVRGFEKLPGSPDTQLEKIPVGRLARHRPECSRELRRAELSTLSESRHCQPFVEVHAHVVNHTLKLGRASRERRTCGHR